MNLKKGNEISKAYYAFVEELEEELKSRVNDASDSFDMEDLSSYITNNSGEYSGGPYSFMNVRENATREAAIKVLAQYKL